MIKYAIRNLATEEASQNPNSRKLICDFFFVPFSKLNSLVVRESYLDELAMELGVSYQAVKLDYNQFEQKQRPKYQSRIPDSQTKESQFNRPVRLTNVEDDLLFILLHDDRIAVPLAYLVEPKWLNIQTISGRILAKILAEINADGPIDVGRMQDFLEDDIERKVFHQTLYRQTEQESENFIQLANECLSVLFLRSSKEKRGENSFPT